MSCTILSNNTGRKGEVVKPKPALTARVVSEGPIGVTIISPNYAHLEHEAVTRFREMTGFECVVIHTGTAGGQSFSAKLNIDLLVAPRPIVFFDADWWPLRPVEFGEFAASAHWCAVADPCAANLGSFCGKDTAREGWEPETYFNSGLFACDLGKPTIRRVFMDAREHLDRVIAGHVKPPTDTTDQFYLNWAVHQQPGLFSRLPLNWNFFNIAVHHGDVTQIPMPIIGLHAAGVKAPQKLEALQREALVFGPPTPGVFHKNGPPNAAK